MFWYLQVARNELFWGKKIKLTWERFVWYEKTKTQQNKNAIW